MGHAHERYIVDEHGRRRAVVLPMREYRELLDDLRDLAIIAERRDEPTEPLELVTERLEEESRSKGLR